MTTEADRKAIEALEAENARLRFRMGRLETEIALQRQHAADLQTQMERQHDLIDTLQAERWAAQP